MSEDLQRRASQGFVRFCRMALSGQAPRPGAGRLPLRDPDALTAEVVAAIQDMAPKAVYRWLLGQLGWQQRAIVDPDDPEETLEARLWSPEVWDAAGLQLRFTAASIDTLLVAWNLSAQLDAADIQQHSRSTARSRRQRRLSAEQREQARSHDRQRIARQLLDQDRAALGAIALKGSGDLLLHHVLARPFLRRCGLADGAAWSRNDPLTRMVASDVAALSAEATGLERLLGDDLLPMLPWIVSDWPRQWRQRHRDRATSLERLRHAWRAQAALWSEWMRLAEAAERLDLLVPLVVGYRDQLRWLARDQKRLDGLLQGERLSTRGAVRAEWADALDPVAQLQRLARAARRLHPIDREAHHRLLLAAAAEHGLDDIAGQLLARAAELRGTIS